MVCAEGAVYTPLRSHSHCTVTPHFEVVLAHVHQDGGVAEAAYGDAVAAGDRAHHALCHFHPLAKELGKVYLGKVSEGTAFVRRRRIYHLELLAFAFGAAGKGDIGIGDIGSPRGVVDTFDLVHVGERRRGLHARREFEEPRVFQSLAFLGNH